MRLFKLRAAVILGVLMVPVVGTEAHAEHSDNDIVEVGRLPDVIFPAGRPSCVYISSGLIKVYGISSNGLFGNDGTSARVLSGFPHVQVGVGSFSDLMASCSPSNKEIAGNELTESDGHLMAWSTNDLYLYSDGTPGSGTIELYSYDNGGPSEKNVDTPRNDWNYPIGYFSYFVTNDITDNALTQIATSANAGPAGNSTVIDNSVTNGQSGMVLTVTQVWNYGSGGCNGSNCVYNNHPVAAIYGYDAPGYWSIVNSDGAAMPVGAAFNVEFVPANADNLFTTASSQFPQSTNVNTMPYTYAGIPGGTLNLGTIMDYNAGALLFPTSLDGRDPHPNGIQFTSPSWAVTNGDLAWMLGSNFSALMIGWPDTAAYIFTQPGPENVYGDSMYLPTFSSSGFADPVGLTRIFVSPTTYVPSSLGVWWDGYEWAAFREDTLAMSSSTSINVYAHRPAIIASPVEGDINGDRLSDFTMVGGPSNPIIESGLAQGQGSYSSFTPLTSLDRTSIDQDFTTSWAQTPGVKVLSGDFDGDGRTDLALTGPSGWSTIPLALSNGDSAYRVTNQGVTTVEPEYTTSMEWPWPAGIKQTTYYDANFTYYASLQGAMPLAGDFNGDGITDIALTGGSGWWTIPVAFSRGDSEGTFVATNAGISGGDGGFPDYAQAAGVKALVGDFNGDRMADIVLVGGPGWWTTPFAQSNGDGTFYCYNYAWGDSSDFADYATTATLAAVGDFNGDHLSDIAIIAGGGPIKIAFSNGDGTFWSTTLANPLANVTSDPNAKLIAGDYNGDGFADLLVVGASVGGYAVIGELYWQASGDFSAWTMTGGLANFGAATDARVASGGY